MQSVVTQLKKIAKKEPLAEKILVVPNYSAGRQLLESCTKQGLNILNLRIDTLFGLAEQTCQRDLLKSKRSVVPATVANELFIRILKRLAANGSLAYFGSLEITCQSRDLSGHFRFEDGGNDRERSFLGCVYQGC